MLSFSSTYHPAGGAHSTRVWPFHFNFGCDVSFLRIVHIELESVSNYCCLQALNFPTLSASRSNFRKKRTTENNSRGVEDEWLPVCWPGVPPWKHHRLKLCSTYKTCFALSQTHAFSQEPSPFHTMQKCWRRWGGGVVFVLGHNGSAVSLLGLLWFQIQPTSTASGPSLSWSGGLFVTGSFKASVGYLFIGDITAAVPALAEGWTKWPWWPQFRDEINL